MAKKKKGEEILKHFFLGIIILVVTQSVFMLGGLIFENNLGYGVTGIPSSIGLTIVLLIGLYYNKKTEYVLLGSFTLAFIAPVILILLALTNGIAIELKQTIYSITYMSLMVFFVWVYYFIKITKNSF